jgi:hypothetical protein
MLMEVALEYELKVPRTQSMKLTWTIDDVNGDFRRPSPTTDHPWISTNRDKLRSFLVAIVKEGSTLEICDIDNTTFTLKALELLSSMVRERRMKRNCRFNLHFPSLSLSLSISLSLSCIG